jgi:hypothetical protein
MAGGPGMSSQCHSMQEFAEGEPPVLINHDSLQERDNDIATANKDHPDLKKDPCEFNWTGNHFCSRR